MNHISARMKYFGLTDLPHFANELLLPWPEAHFRDAEPYVIEEQRHGCASLNVFRVVGTKHPCYAGESWLNLLEKGKRMDRNLNEFSNNPDYYSETGAKIPYMQYVSIDSGDLYIGDEGNHRTCISRFHFYTKGLTILHGITWLDYRIDWSFKSLCDEIQRVAAQNGTPIYLKINKHMVERRDASDWMLNKYALTAEILDTKNHCKQELDFDGLQKLLDRLKKPWWKIW